MLLSCPHSRSSKERVFPLLSILGVYGSTYAKRDSAASHSETDDRKGACMSYTVTFVRAATPKTKKKDLPSRKPIKGGALSKVASSRD